MIKRNKTSARFTEEGGTIVVSVEDTAPLGVNVVAEDDIELGTAVVCSSTFAGRAGVFVSAAVLLVVSC